MDIYTDAYVNKCLEIGILTEQKVRKYPLRNANLAMVLKAYAITTYKPYTIYPKRYDVLDEYELYLTDGGLEWLFHVFSKYTLTYLRSVFQFVFAKATEEDIKDIDNYQGYNNFKGLAGVKPKAGTKQKAILVRKVKRVNREFHFDTLKEARERVLDLTRFYPADQFTLYRVRKQTKKGKTYYYKEEVPLFVQESKRGKDNNLPNLR